MTLHFLSSDVLSLCLGTGFNYILILFATGTVLSTTVSSLRSGAVYYFKVQAATSAGYGPLSDVAFINFGSAGKFQRP